ncbi:Protease 1 precursor [Planctomycetes bacterium Pla163]|uniref:Protease 1 n=1 Tax=Rohdeia mirabilis TaxID=2528008 RepID=A0A518D3H1_9BACT|nr:Protease 1 precursor [Planctomycetes bacterium Pla163]
MQSPNIARAAITLAAGALLAGTASAQIRSDEVPAAVMAGLDPKFVPVSFIEPPDVERYKAEDLANGYRPLRYGALMPTDIGTDDQNGGVWDILPDGTRVWRFKIHSPGAFTIGLEFDDFKIPSGAYCTMYDEDMRTFYGAYGAVNNQPNEEILFEPFPGDNVVFEYVQPAGVRGEPLLNLGTVIYDYRDVDNIQIDQLFAAAGLAPAPGSCDFIDVNCPQGDPWELQKRAVVRTLSGGALCSGALLNNTSNDGTAYVLTADHCGQDANTSFRFNYQRSGCGSGSSPTNQNMSGCTVLTSTSTYDSRLLLINNTIPTNYNPFFAGWTRSSTNPSLAFSITHPSGGPKKISIDGNGASKGSISVPNSAWFVDWSEGWIEGGSSGGPLFDQNGRVRGPACCVNEFVCATQTAWYGRFDRFYTNNNLGQWLDPANSNQTSIDGFDPNAPTGGGGNVVINSATPSILQAVRPDAPTQITLSGSGFAGTTGIEVDGTPLVSFAYSVVNDTTITLSYEHVSSLGPIDIEVFDAAGSDTTSILMVPNTSLELELVGSDPSFIIQATGVRAYVGAPLTHYCWLTLSLSNTASVLPGLVNLGLGNNFFELYVLWEGGVNPAKGYRFFNSGALSGYPIGTKLYLQAVSYNTALPSFPLNVSNLETGTLLF